MKNPQRREFIKKAAGGLGAISSLSLLPPAILRALAIEPSVVTGTILDVKHIVILMQENRSFNHYFGTLRGVRGFSDRFPIPLQSGKPVWFQTDGQKEILPYHLDARTTSALLVPDTPHTFPGSQAAWNQGKFGQWPLYKTGYSMGYYRREDIPFQFALADAFTICDSYHCSLTSCTDPNRIVFMSGSNFDPNIARQGHNCTDSNAEITNVRCLVTGAMPAPGYQFSGSSLRWRTLPELLQEAGVSWRIYQDPNDNWSGLMHGGLAFDAFRNATANSGSALYENGMRHWSINDLRRDAAKGSLPSVSWILPSPLQSEHPAAGSSPGRAGYFTAKILNALIENPETWSQTAFFITFDENDGFFDHIPPPAVPSYNADGSLAGKATLALDGEYFSDPTGAYREPGDSISGSLRPWGLGPRVPMYVISPWSRGGWVNSQVFDHTSMGMFLEKRFEISVDSISPWHRAVCGDLTSAFAFNKSADTSWSSLPDVSNFVTVEATQRSLPLPTPPQTQEPLFQEPGTRRSRALPYELHTGARLRDDGTVSLTFTNSGAQGAVFHVYDKLHLDRIPRRYTVEAGKHLSDIWNPHESDAGAYQLWVYSTNGYVRTFEGDFTLYGQQEFKPEIGIRYEPANDQVDLEVHNTGTAAGEVFVTANAYRDTAREVLEISANSTRIKTWNLYASGHWYDFTVSAIGFERRFAGRLETGKDGISDPAM